MSDEPIVRSSFADVPIGQNDNMFHITVADPEKVGDGMQAFTTYKVTTTTTKSGYKESPFMVTRRYRDFTWLRSSVAKEYRGCVVPPLPGKQVMNKFDAEFIEARRRELERFLKRVTAHPSLRDSLDLQAFLQGTDEQLEQQKKEKSAESGGGGGWARGLMSKASKKVTQITSSPAVEVDQWFDAKTNLVMAIESQLANLADSASKMVDLQRRGEAAFGELSNAASLMANAEADGDATLHQNFNRIAETAMAMQQFNKELGDGETVYWEEALRDYHRVLGAVREMLNNRTAALSAQQAAAKSLEGRQDRVASAKPNQVAKAEQDVKDAEADLAAKKKAFEDMSEQCREEIARYEEQKSHELNHAITVLIQMLMNFSLKSADQFKNLLAEVSPEAGGDL